MSLSGISPAALGPTAPFRPGETKESGRNQAGKTDQPERFATQAPDSAEAAQVAKLAARDREVRAHELAHQAAGGGHAGHATYVYATGPDGQRYAIGGSVAIDTGAAADPADTVAKMRQVRRAALAPANPSAQDRAIAAKAAATERQARIDLQAQNGALAYQRDAKLDQAEAGRAQATATAAGGVLSEINASA